MIGDPDIPLDLGDPHSIAEAVPRIEAIVASKQQVALEANADLENWRALLRNLRSIAGLAVHISDSGRPNAPGPSPAALDAVVRVVEGDGGTMQPISVERILLDEGHEVDGREAVFAALAAAVTAGRLRQTGPRQFAPALPTRAARRVMTPVPEAHLGLDGPPPRSKAEAVLRILGSAPARAWRAEDVGKMMIERGWMTDSDKDFASLGAILSRLHSERKLQRPERGLYRLSPLAEARK